MLTGDIKAVEAIQRLDSKLFYRLAQKFKEDIRLHVDKPGSILIERLDTEEGLSKFVATLSNIVENLVLSFKSFQHILAADIPQLDEVEGIGEVRARTIKQSLKRMQEQFVFDNLIL